MAHKNLNVIEAELDAHRNALAAQQLHAESRQTDPTVLLLWGQALDQAEFLVGVVRSMSETGALQQQVVEGAAERLQEVERGREAVEAENTRLSQENTRLHSLLADLSPREYSRFMQARACQ